MKVFIPIGIPGSGKSTLSRELAAKYNAVVCSADDYFMNEGVYKFDPSKLRNAHQKCKDDFISAVGVQNVIVDNTNLKNSDVDFYVKSAVENGCEIYFLEPETNWKYDANECFIKNTHGVPLAKIEEMLQTLRSNGGRLQRKNHFTNKYAYTKIYDKVD